jgi:hypothetical protein
VRLASLGENALTALPAANAGLTAALAERYYQAPIPAPPQLNVFKIQHSLKANSGGERYSK